MADTDATGRDKQRASDIYRLVCDQAGQYPRACIALAAILAAGQPAQSQGWQMAQVILNSTCLNFQSKEACAAERTLEWQDSTVFHRDRPVVTQEHTFYPEYRFQPFDFAVVKAGGCVNHHGKGGTTKHFVDPPPADGFYWGLINLPSMGWTRLSNLTGKAGYQIKPNVSGDYSKYYLGIGYHDTDGDYADNAYDNFDDAQDCKKHNFPAAYVHIVVHHLKIFQDRDSVLASLKGMDLWWDLADANNIPFEPDWVSHWKNPKQLPDAGALCNLFQYKDGTFFDLGSDCFTAVPTIDTRDDLSWWDYAKIGIAGGTLGLPGEAILAGLDHDLVLRLVCNHFSDGKTPTHDETVKGHINWTTGTFGGAIYFRDFQIPFLTAMHPFHYEDGDYDLALVTKNHLGTVVGSELFGNPPQPAIGLEFLSNEVIDLTRSTWWQTLHSAVDWNDTPFGGHDWQAAKHLVNEKESIVIGLLGIDAKHSYQTELHPVYAMAIRIGGANGRERWAIIARGSGNEGGCSQGRHWLSTADGKVRFFFDRPLELDASASVVRWGAPLGIPGSSVSNAVLQAFDQDASSLIKASPSRNGAGTVLEVQLRNQDEGVLYGEVDLCNNKCQEHHFLPITVANLRTPSPGHSHGRASEREPMEGPRWEEGNLRPVIEGLSTDKRMALDAVAPKVLPVQRFSTVPPGIAANDPRTKPHDIRPTGAPPAAHAEDIVGLRPVRLEDFRLLAQGKVEVDSVRATRTRLLDSLLLHVVAGGSEQRLDSLITGAARTTPEPSHDNRGKESGKEP